MENKCELLSPVSLSYKNYGSLRFKGEMRYRASQLQTNYLTWTQSKK